MTINRRFLVRAVALAVLTAVAGWAIWWLSSSARLDIAANPTGNPQVELPAGDSIHPASESVEEADSPDHAAPAAPELPKPIFDVIQTFGELQSTLATSQISEGQKLEFLRLAAIGCENHAFTKAVPPNPRLKWTPEEVQSRQIARDFLERFCRDFTGTSGEISARMTTLPSDSDILVAQTLFDVGENGEAAPLAEEILFSTTEPSALLQAAGYLVATDRASWGNENLTGAERALDPSSLSRSHLLAARLLACEYAGGCGPGGYTSMLECGNAGVCRPNISAAEVWRRNYSQTEYQLAESLRERLRELRTSKGPS